MGAQAFLELPKGKKRTECDNLSIRESKKELDKYEIFLILELF